MPRRSVLFLLCTAIASAPSRSVAEDPSSLIASELKVCREVVDRACKGDATRFGPDVRSVTFFTRIEGATGEAWVTHVFRWQGKEVRRIRRPILGSSYRTWSVRDVAGQAGAWRAEVLDPVGRSLGRIDFVVESGPPPTGGPLASP